MLYIFTHRKLYNNNMKYRGIKLDAYSTKNLRMMSNFAMQRKWSGPDNQ